MLDWNAKLFFYFQALFLLWVLLDLEEKITLHNINHQISPLLDKQLFYDIPQALVLLWSTWIMFW